MSIDREIYRLLKSAGLCVRCKQPAVRGKVMCCECHRKASLRAAERRTRLKAAGLCIRCQKPAREGRVYCADCSAKMTIANAARKDRRKAAGLCVWCGNPVRPGSSKCESCLEKDRRLQANKYHKRQNLRGDNNGAPQWGPFS